MKFKITFLRGTKEVSVIEGEREVSRDEITVGEMETVIPAEQLLEKLTGLRVHIETVV